MKMYKNIRNTDTWYLCWEDRDKNSRFILLLVIHYSDIQILVSYYSKVLFDIAKQHRLFLSFDHETAVVVSLREVDCLI